MDKLLSDKLKDFFKFSYNNSLSNFLHNSSNFGPQQVLCYQLDDDAKMREIVNFNSLGFPSETIHAAVPIRSISKALLVSAFFALMEMPEYNKVLHLEAKVDDFYSECHGGQLADKTIKQLIMMDAGLDKRGIIIHSNKYFHKTRLRSPGNGILKSIDS